MAHQTDREQLEKQGKSLPYHVHRELEGYLKCGRLEHGFLRVRCDKCHFERLVAFSCKKRGFCPSCGTRRMAETAALLADEQNFCKGLRLIDLAIAHDPQIPWLP